MEDKQREKIAVCGLTDKELIRLMNDNYIKNEKKTKINAPKKRR